MKSCLTSAERQELISRLKLRRERIRRLSRNDPAAFRRWMILDAEKGQSFQKFMQPWQERDFAALDWTAGLLQAGLQQQLDWTVSDDSLREKLHDLDYVWKRYRDTLKPDPFREKKDASSYMPMACRRNGRAV